MSKLWFYMISIGIISSIAFNKLADLNKTIIFQCTSAIEFTISLIGMMALWMGLMNIAKESGLMDIISKILYPAVKILFPSIPKKSKALSYIIMNIALNMLGASNGATAFGLKAMEELQTLNHNKKVATNDMVMFLTINIASVQLVPFTILKIRFDEGANNPNNIVISTLFATIISGVVAIVVCKILERRFR